MPNHGHSHDHHHDEAVGELLDLSGVVLRQYWTDAFDWVRRHLDSSPARIADLGAGTGVGAAALARTFPDAEIVAVDSSEEMIERVPANIEAHDWGTRVRAVTADLDDAFPDLAPLDLAWASNSLHHVADPARTLAWLHDVVRPGGAVAVAEFHDAMRVLPPDLADLEQRSVDAQAAAYADELPHLGSDWSAKLRDAGFADVVEQPFVIDLPVTSAPARRFVRVWLQRVRTAAQDHLDAADREALADLLDRGGLEQRDDLRISETRTVSLGHRR